MAYQMGQVPPPPMNQQMQFMQGQGHMRGPPPPSQHYGGGQMCQNIHEVQAWQAMAFKSEQEFRACFDYFKNQSLNGIQAEELQKILNTNPQIQNYYCQGNHPMQWNLELCKIMINMLDRSRDGIMQYEEFRELLQCLVFWYQTFMQYDLDRSGYVEANELINVIRTRFGYNLSADAVKTLLQRYSKAVNDAYGNVRCLTAFDDFTACSVRLRSYTESFRARDRNCHGGHETGSTTFGYDDFIQMVMGL